jgi:PAS domain S-box-containing protein
MFGIHQDISERKKAEMALKKSEERFRKLFNNSSGISIQGYAPDRSVIYWNKSSEKLYGYTEEEAMGKNLLELIIPDELKEGVKLAIETAIKTGINIPASELRLKTKTGKYVDVFSSHVFIEYPNKKTEFFCIDMDLTEINRQRERAEAANKTKSDFLANMSHELRTPLNGVIGFGQILKDTNLDYEQKEYADIVMTSAKSLLEIINDILDFSKIEAGKLRLNLETTDLYELTESVIKIIKFKINEKGLKLSEKIAADIPRYFLSDSVRLKQILINLLSNAVKFTETGSIAIIVDKLSDSTKNNKVKLLFSIIDTGIGIKRENTKKILEPFNQEDYSTTRRFGGTGLGLTITQNLLNLMNSSLKIESTPGKGSRFYFEIEFQLAEKMLNIKTLKNFNLTNKKILIVEDNTINMKIAESLLHKICSGLIVQKVHSGKEAIEFLKHTQTDLILMDLKMPDLDGYETTKIIRTSHKELPIIALTAMGVNEEREKCFEYGMNDYISKPFTVEKLKNILLEYIKN